MMYDCEVYSAHRESRGTAMRCVALEREECFFSMRMGTGSLKFRKCDVHSAACGSHTWFALLPEHYL